VPTTEYAGLAPRDPAPQLWPDTSAAQYPVVRAHIKAGSSVPQEIKPAWIVGDATAGVVGRFSVGVASSGNWWVVGAAGANGQVGTFVIGDGDGSTDLTAWVEVTCDLEEWQLEQRVLRSLDQFDAAQLTVRLNNSHREWDPDNAASPYNLVLATGEIDPGLRPGTPIMLTATWDGTAYPLFTGEIDEVPDRVTGGRARWVDIRATDAFAVIGAYDGEEQAAAGGGELADARVGRILDMVGWPRSLRNYTGLFGVPLQATTLAGNALSLIKQAVSSEGGRVWVSGDGAVQVRSHSDLYNEPTSHRMQFSAGDDLKVNPSDLGTVRDREQLVNRVSYARVGGTAVVVSDEESVNRYRVRSAVRTDLLCSSDLDVASLARRDLNVQAWLEKRLPKLSPNLADSRWWRHVLGWQPRYRCEVRWTPGEHSGFGDPENWAITSAGAGAATVSSTAVTLAAANGGTAGFARATWARPVMLKDAQAAVQLTGFDTSGADYLFASFGRAWFDIYATTIQLGFGAASVSATYSTSTFRWIRIREVAGQLYMDRSADGVSWVLGVLSLVSGDPQLGQPSFYATRYTAGSGALVLSNDSSGVWADSIVHDCFVDGRRITASAARWDVELTLTDATGWRVWTVGDPDRGRVGAGIPIAW
jgi:hypothetical protein